MPAMLAPRPPLPSPASSPLFTTTSDPIFRLSAEKFDEMVRLGLVNADDPVELIEGVLAFKVPMNPPHATAVGLLQDALPRLIPEGWFIRIQSTVALPDSRPDPDVAIARGRRIDYQDRHPAPADLALVIEVADTTLATDRTRKLRMYAGARVAEYWIVNLIDRQIEVHAQPDGTGPEPGYASRVVRAIGEQVSLPAALGGAAINVAELLPPA